MNSIFKLFLATFFYHHLEFDDGIEAYLKPSPANNKDNVNPINLRYIYDLLFALILKVMIIQLVSGTIIDNFAALRAKEERFNFGDWGLGIGDWAQSPIPNPQSPNYTFKKI